MAGKRALVLVADGCEDIETVTVVDILRRSGVDVTVCSVHSSSHQMITMANKVVLVPDAWLAQLLDKQDELDKYDVVVLPGGLQAANTFKGDSQVQDVLKRFHGAGKYIAAICAGPTALANLVTTKTKVTAYPSCKSDLEGKCHWVDSEDVVCDGQFITSKGPATAMCFALAIVKVLVGQDAKEKVAKGVLCK